MQKLLTKSKLKKTGNITESSNDIGDQTSDPTIPSEHLEQCRFISRFRKKFPGVRIIAIPNGGWRDIKTAARLKAEGVTKGVPDLFIPEWRFWIEMKRQKGGALSDDQKDWIDYLQKKGYKAVCCKGAGEAMDAASERLKEINDGTVTNRLGKAN